MLVITLLAYCYPQQAIVRALGYDERTIKDWWQRSGTHCRRVHEHLVETQQLDLLQVQADEIKAKIQGERLDGNGVDGSPAVTQLLASSQGVASSTRLTSNGAMLRSASDWPVWSGARVTWPRNRCSRPQRWQPS